MNFGELKTWRKQPLDRRLRVEGWSGSGEQATFEVYAHPEAKVEYDDETQDTPLWTPVRVSPDGRAMSGLYYSFFTSHDAVTAIVTGEAWES